MRRFWAFIIMLTSVLLSVVFCAQPVLDRMVLSTEYGGGKEVVYQLKKRDGGSSIDPDKAGDLVMERLDTAGVKNAHVEVSGSGDEAQLRVFFAPKTTAEYDNVLSQVSANGALSICTKDDYCLTGSEFFTATPMSLRYLGSNAYPAFNIKSKAAAERFVGALGTDEGATAYVWQNRDETSGEDNYENAFGTDADPDVKAKVIAQIAWEGNYLEEEQRVYTTADKSGNAFTLSSARAYVNAYNNADYGFEISKLYETKVGPTLGASALQMTLVAIVVALAVIGLALIAFYGAAGATGFVSLIATLTVSIFAFSFLGFEFTPAAIIGLVVTCILAVFTTVNYFEKIKDELKKGRTIAKANAEGYRKSFFVTMDASLVTFFVSLFAFVLGQGIIKTFGGVIFIGAIATFLINTFLNKWMIYWLATSDFAKKGKGILGLRLGKNLLEDRKVYADGEAKRKKNIGGLVGAGAVVLATAALLVTGLTGGVFNNSDDYSSSGRLNVKTTSDEDAYKDEERYLAYLAEKNIAINYENVDFERVEKTDEYGEDYFITYISFKTAERIADNDLIGSLRVIMQNDDEEATVTSETSRVVNISHDTSSLFLVFGLSILFAALYLLLRYGISVFISYLCSASVVGLFSVGLFSALRLPYNSFAGFGLLAVMIVLSFITIAMFGRNRDNLKDQKIYKTATFEQRSAILSTSFINSFPAYLSTALIALTFGVALIAITSGSALLSEFLIFDLAMIIGLAFFGVFTGPFYLFLRTHLRFKKIDFARFFKRRKKPVKVNLNEPHETIIPGMNDFR